MAFGFGDLLGGITFGATAIFWVALLLLFALLSFVFIYWFIGFLRYNHNVTMYIKTKGGVAQRRLKGGYVRNRETKKWEFRLAKPKLTINNFNREWVLPRAKKGKPEVYVWLLQDDKVVQLNTHFQHEVSPGNYSELFFIPRQLGKDRFEEEFDKHTEEMYSAGDWFTKHAEKIFWTSVLLIQLMVIFFLVNKVL